MDVEQLGSFRSVEGAGTHGGDQVEYAPSWNRSGSGRNWCNTSPAGIRETENAA